MRVFLLYPDQDFQSDGELYPNEPTITPDLDLSTLWQAMARGDDFLREMSQRIILTRVTEIATIGYRQDVLQDSLDNESLVREIYSMAVSAIEREKKSYFGFFSRYPSAILGRSLEVMTIFVEILERLRALAETYKPQFKSSGFSRFFAMVIEELGTDYLIEIRRHLRELKFQKGLFMSVRLGPGNKGSHYILNPRPTTQRRRWIQRIAIKEPDYLTYVVADRDEAGARALTELWDRGIDVVANALAQSVDHILGFFIQLRMELGFYVAGMNLYETLRRLEAPVCFPTPLEFGAPYLGFEELYDPCLLLRRGESVSGNTLTCHDKTLTIITGANQGGKSTFLRSIGLAQLMMQAGLFVGAKSWRTPVASGVFTHYKREEDGSMQSGKLDEELQRMSEVVDQIRPHAMILFNESFTATNEREGSEISRQILRALGEKHITVFFVTHLYELARTLYDEHSDHVLFLRAQRAPDGSRTFRLIEAPPLNTSYGEDVYREIFEV